MDVKKAAKGTIIVFALTFIGLGLNYVYGIFLARWYGAGAYGIYSIGLSLFGVFSILSVSGLDNAALKFAPKTSDLDYGVLLKDIMSIGLLFSCILGGGLFWGRNLLAIDIYHIPKLQDVIAYFALAIPAYSLSTILLAFLQASHDVNRRMSIKYAIEPVVKTILTFGFTLLGVDIIGAVAALASGLFITTLLALRPLLKKARLLAAIRKVPSAPASQFKPILRYSLPIMVGIAFSVSASKSDFIILGYLVSESDVGLYAAAYQTAAIMSIILQSVESVIAPYISEAINKKSLESLKEVYKLSLRWVYILGAPLYLFFILFPQELLFFFGEQFKTAALCFSLLATGQFINIATGSANYMLLMQGKTKWVMVNSIINGSMQVGLNIYLIPQFGIIGAAVSMIAATTLINVLRLIEVYVLLKIHPYSLNLIKPTLIALLTYGAVFLLKQEMETNIQILLAPTTFIIYFVLLLSVGLTVSEKSMLYAAILKFKK